MKTALQIALTVLMLSFIGTIALAQDKSQAYYSTHEKEILPDAQTAFKNGNYEQAEKLCQWHFIMVGDHRADALREKAAQCAKLVIEMKTLASYGNKDAAREKAQAILALNPDDTVAQQLVALTGMENNHEWVDLGLSVKWATCNVGADKPEDSGFFFAWGETKPKADYSLENYQFLRSGNNINSAMFSKYSTKSERGVVDNKTRLDLSDDAARSIWGGNWRLPTLEEQNELKTKCTWTWTTLNGTPGYKVTSKINGKSIFLPAAGYRRGTTLVEAGTNGHYWSSALRTDNPYFSYRLTFSSSVLGPANSYRCDGFSVRPVIQ